MAKSTQAAAHSPLANRIGPDGNPVALTERAHLGKINLRGDAGDKAFLDGVARAAGVAPPVKANTVATAGTTAILWLGPDEWLVVTPAGGQGAMESSLTTALAGQHVSIVDVTDARTTIRISGPRARDTVAKACPLDLHPREFAAGQCAQTLLAKTDVLIHQVGDTPAYDLYVLCSFSRYLWDWLADSAKEFA